MKITAVLGSPRSKGNSTTIVNLLIAKLQPFSTQPKIFELNKLLYRGCQGCMVCKMTSERCVLKDGLTEVLKEIESSDLVIIASPVYIGEVNAQTKGLIDRLYSFFKPDYRTNPNPGRLETGKKLVFVLSQGNPDENVYADIVSRYSGFMKRTGFTETIALRAVGVGQQSDVTQNDSVLQLVSTTAAKLLGS